jgi:hypothetical protein
MATPLGVLINILAALKVFSVEWAKGSIAIATLVGSVLGYLTWSSGRSLLRGDAAAFRRTCLAGGLSLGYTIAGIWIMTTAGIDRGLEILIRHGSENWWNWSLSHFQNSSLLEIPLMTWWVLGLGTVLRYRLSGGPQTGKDRLAQGLWLILLCMVGGGVARLIQLAQDTLLASQR